MRKFVVACLRHETNTFSPIPTPLESFGRGSGGTGPAEGQQAIDSYRGTNTPIAAFFDLVEQAGDEMVVPLAANAHPSAPCSRESFDHMADRIVAAVKAGCDAALLDLHGAMVAEGLSDGEGELLRRVREVAPGLPIAVALDYHTNLSPAMVENADVITVYRTYPHIDMYETGERCGRTLLRMLAGEIRPRMVWHSLPILSHMNVHAPSRPPMQAIMASALQAEASGEVLNASLIGGFPLADIEHVGLAAIVVGDEKAAGGVDRAERLLYDLMNMAWEKRAEFEYTFDPIDKSVADGKAAADKAGDGPVLLVDHGDNAGAGGNQDTMAVLAEVMRQDLGDVVAGPIRDPEAVKQAITAGVGATVTLAVGGKWDVPALKLKGEPLTITGRVTRVTDGSFTITGPMMTGMKANIGRTVVLDTGKVQLVISEGAYEPFDTGCFTHLGIDPARKRFVVLKSRQHFRAGFEPIAKEIVLVAGPGPCSSDYSLFPWDRVRRPIYPLDRDCPSNLPRQS